MPRIIKREIVYAAKQAAAGTAADIVGGSALRAYDVGWSYEGIKTIERPVMGGALGMPGNIYGGSMGKLSVSWQMSGDGNAASAEHAALYEACGMDENINLTAGSEGVEYNLISTGHPLLTLVINQDGYQRKIVDARATAFSITATAGEAIVCTAEFAGILASDSEVAASAVAPIYPVTNPIVVRGATIGITEVGGSAIEGAIETLGVDFGLETATNPDMSATDGFAAPVITNRKITITANPEFEGAPDWIGRMRLNKEFKVQATFDSYNAVQNRVTFIAPTCRITETPDGDRNGIRTRDLSFMAGRSAAGDDEFQIIFT